MKKIIFVINNLQTGGVQISLLNLLKEIHNDYDVTVLCFYCKDEYRALVPDNVKLMGLNSPFRYFGVSQGELHSKPFQYSARAFWAVLTKLFGRSSAIKLMSLFQKKIGTYDCAISYLHEASQKSFYGGCNEYVLKKVKAEKKITWVHCDFGLSGANSVKSRKIYGDFDTIIACSEGTKAAFLRCLPEFESRCIAVRNCHDYENIRRLAGDGIRYEDGCFHIVTVARLSAEKGIERAISAVKTGIENGHRIRYHLVGSGNMEATLKNLVAENHMEDCVLFYGNQTNPYPYMKNADLFLLPSYHEAAPMVFDEAACLGVPVLATETTSTDEMIKQNRFGFVCENSLAGITQSLLGLLNDPDELTSVRTSLENQSFSNCNNISAFYSVVNSGHI